VSEAVDWNFTPISTAVGSLSATTVGTSLGLKGLTVGVGGLRSGGRGRRRRNRSGGRNRGRDRRDLVGDQAVLGSGVAGGHNKIVGLTSGQAGDDGRAGIGGLGIRARGGAVIDVVPDDRSIGIRVPGQGDPLSSGLGDRERTQKERSGAQPQQRAAQKVMRDRAEMANSKGLRDDGRLLIPPCGT
jgi:hypothetical protein